MSVDSKVNNIITCQEAWEIITQDENSILIDVRTEAEWKSVGKPKLNNPNQLLLNSLKTSPSMLFNKDFMEILLQKTANKSKKFFLCRYGIRSAESCQLALNNGIKDCYNLIDGFDGNDSGPGWQRSKLPIEF
jgi:rhodanese-related sulfurtransferase